MAMHGNYMYDVASFHVCLSEFLYSDLSAFMKYNQNFKPKGIESLSSIELDLKSCFYEQIAFNLQVAF